MPPGLRLPQPTRSCQPLQVHESVCQCATLPPPLKFPHGLLRMSRPIRPCGSATKRIGPQSLPSCSAVLPLNGPLTIRSGAKKPVGCSPDALFAAGLECAVRNNALTTSKSVDRATNSTEAIVRRKVCPRALPFQPCVTWPWWHRTG